MGLSNQTEPDGTILRRKFWLVSKGYQQHHGVDFQETYIPVIKQPSVLAVISLAVSQNGISDN